jgi:hypothetical protein
MDARQVLVVTNRPAIANSWFDDFETFIAWQTNYSFISTTDSLKDRPVFTRDEFIKQMVNMPKDERSDRHIIFAKLLTVRRKELLTASGQKQPTAFTPGSPCTSVSFPLGM